MQGECRASSLSGGSVPSDRTGRVDWPAGMVAPDAAVAPGGAPLQDPILTGHDGGAQIDEDAAMRAAWGPICDAMEQALTTPGLPDRARRRLHGHLACAYVLAQRPPAAALAEDALPLLAS